MKCNVCFRISKKQDCLDLALCLCTVRLQGVHNFGTIGGPINEENFNVQGRSKLIVRYHIGLFWPKYCMGYIFEPKLALPEHTKAFPAPH